MFYRFFYRSVFCNIRLAQHGVRGTCSGKFAPWWACARVFILSADRLISISDIVTETVPRREPTYTRRAALGRISVFDDRAHQTFQKLLDTQLGELQERRNAGAERSAGARARPMPLDQAFVMKTTFSRHTGGGGVYGTIPQWKPKPDIVPPPANCGGFTYGGAGRMWEPLPLPSSIIPKETTEWRNYRHLGMNAPLAFSAPVIIHKDLMRSISP